MRLCEYVNNLISLNMLNKQIMAKYIRRVALNKELDYTLSIMGIYNEHPNDDYIFLRVEKEGHKPLYKIIDKYIEGEEYIDNYIIKHGIIPMLLKITAFYEPFGDPKDIYIMLDESYLGSSSFPFGVHLEFK